MQLANRAPTGCGMIEVSFNAEEVSENEYFDALLGKTSATNNNQQQASTVPMATIPEYNNSQQQATTTAAAQPLTVGGSKQQSQLSNQFENSTTNNNNNNIPTFAPLAAQSQNGTTGNPSSATSAQITASSSTVGDDVQNNTLPPQPQQTQPQTEQTPDVSILVADQQQQTTATLATSLPQQHQIPALGFASSSASSLPPLPPSQSGVMPSSFDSYQQSQSNQNRLNNNNNNTITVQAPASSNVPPLPQPQAQIGYIPQVMSASTTVMTTGPAPSSSRAGMFSSSTHHQGRAPSSGRTASSGNVPIRPHSAGGNNNNNTSVLSQQGNKSNIMMNNTSSITAAGAASNTNWSIYGGKSGAAGAGVTKSERYAATAARWFEMIRSGGSSVGTALREIRAASEKDPSVVLEACDASGRTVLHEAAWSGTVELFQELLSLAIRAGNTRGTAMSMQLWANEQHNIAAWSTVQPEGYQGPKYVTVNAGNTVLHTAATAGRSDMVDWMLRQGAVFVAMAQTRNNRGLRPLESAAERGHLETAKILARSTTA